MAILKIVLCKKIKDKTTMKFYSKGKIENFTGRTKILRFQETIFRQVPPQVLEKTYLS